MRRAALALAILVTAPALAATEVPPKVVVAYGDSITLGNTLPEVQRDQVWVRRVEQLAHGRLVLVNEGQGGRWTRSLDQFDAMLRRQPRADVLVLALGTNDSNDASVRMVGRATGNLRSMMTRAQRAWGATLRVVIVGPPQLRPDKRPDAAIATARNERLRALNAAYEQLAQQTRARYLSLYGVPDDASLEADGMHPDAAGNEAIARKLLPVLLEAAGP